MDSLLHIIGSLNIDLDEVTAKFNDIPSIKAKNAFITRHIPSLKMGIDLTITAKSPRLAERLDAMGAAIASALGIAADAVAVKASTGNLIGDEGAGRAIRCQAILLAEYAPA